jgi:hypothetical protein
MTTRIQKLWSTPERRTSLGFGLILALVGGAHTHFILVDQRLPQDMGLYFQELPELYRAWWGKAPTTVIWDTLLSSGGWLQVLISGVLAVVGRGGEAFRIFDLIFTLSCVGLTGAVVRQVAGPRAGLIATMLAAITPMIVVTGRSSWIHIPELALLLGALYALVRDPKLSRRRTVGALIVLGGLCLTLRPSALVWMGTLVPLLLLQIRTRPKPVIAVLTGWAVSLPIALSDFAQYMEAKGFARERYARSVPELSHEVLVQIGPVLCGLALVGVLCALSRRSGRLALLAAVWVVIGYVLYGHFRAGLNNFSPMAAGLCIVTAIGLAQRLGPWGGRLALGAFLFTYSLQWLPPPGPDEPAKGRFLALTRPSAPGNFAIPYTGFSARLVVALVHSSCPDPSSPCFLVADQGLFHPYSEDPSGQLERFLARLDHVTVLDISRPDMQVPVRIPNGLARFACGNERDLKWRERHPHSKDNLKLLIETYDLRVAWSRHFGADCRYGWMMPAGTNLDWAIAPEGTGHDTTVERLRGEAPPDEEQVDRDAP